MASTTASIVLNVLWTLAIMVIIIGFRRAYDHPLSGFPGPFLWKISRLPQTFYLYRGTQPWKIHELHEKYGPAVRIAPNEISFSCTQAWTDIYARGPDRSQFQKARNLKTRVSSQSSGASAIIFAYDDDVHARQRRNMSHVFSAANLRAQHPIVSKYTNQLVGILKSSGTKSVDICAMLEFLLFDITGDLTFGDSFNCLTDNTLHPWLELLTCSIATAVLVGAAQQFWPFTILFFPFIPKRFFEGDKNMAAYNKERLDARLKKQDPRPDFIATLQRNFEDKKTGISYAELVEETRTLVIAGAETTSTLLAGLFYYLLANPDDLTLLTQEIRSAFASPDQITFASTSSLPWLEACIKEALRLCPPLPGLLRRVVPSEGRMIAGRFVKGGTVVAVDIMSANFSSANFALADQFRPERWAQEEARDPVFKNDKLAAVQPFSVGPRNCIGQRLAMMEIPFIMATLLWHFDISLEEESKGWKDNLRVYGFFQKPKLMVEICRRRSQAL